MWERLCCWWDGPGLMSEHTRLLVRVDTQITWLLGREMMQKFQFAAKQKPKDSAVFLQKIMIQIWRVKMSSWVCLFGCAESRGYLNKVQFADAFILRNLLHDWYSAFRGTYAACKNADLQLTILSVRYSSSDKMLWRSVFWWSFVFFFSLSR